MPRTRFPVYLFGKLEGKELNLFCSKSIVQKRSPNYFLKKLICLNGTILPCIKFVVVNVVNLGARIVNHTAHCTPHHRPLITSPLSQWEWSGSKFSLSQLLPGKVRESTYRSTISWIGKKSSNFLSTDPFTLQMKKLKTTCLSWNESK